MSNETAPEQQSPALAIEDLVDDLADLAVSGVSSESFYPQLLNQSVMALGAIAGSYYTVSPRRPTGSPDRWEMACQYRLATEPQLAEFVQQPAHLRLLDLADRTGESLSLPPNASPNELPTGQAANQTETFLLICPVIVEEETVALIEVFQRPNTSREARVGFLRFLQTVSEIAGDFHRNLELRTLRRQFGTWRRFEEFADTVHAHLDRDQVAYHAANEGRRLIDCDRVNVGRMRGRRCQILAVSGQAHPDRRSNVLRRLSAVCEAVVKTRQPLWWSEDTDEAPPQIKSLLRLYLDDSHARWVGIVPLLEPQIDDEHAKKRPHVLGVLIAERFDGEHDAILTQQHTEIVSQHTAVALHNADVHQSIPFFPILKTIQNTAWYFRLRQLPKTAFVVGLLAAAILALVLVPAELTISGDGELQPQTRRDVFARSSGEVETIHAEHGNNVTLGQELVRLRRSELDLEIAEVTGQLQTDLARLASVRSSELRRQTGLSLSEARIRKEELASEKAELQASIDSLNEQLSILRQQEKQLIVTSPISGQVLTWDVETLLAERPVERGQILMTVANVDGPWVVEIRVPDHDIGHVLAAQKESQDGLPVSFILATDPATTYSGKVIKTAMNTELDEENAATVLVTVAIDREQIPNLRPGATVVPKIACGQRPVGYVWFHDLWDAIRTYVIF
ncbi:efflux RND transporter periplasmic adaptor subunit [Thalassoroseus pseudoceratinae]|uniref:efflux RND transporter periplasmic adaptor subunit n=1 Tax=Thalassoroseus pseudoceratinae TaxID=2713176 RepID=UPI001420EBF6|nr:HlyD family efflux transporter periplasmic adaptor subunit [Thalassoroseus pseudoceratinae]